jgi:hypothetical protein
MRAYELIDPSAIAGEAVLVSWHESPGGTAYVSELAQVAQEILRRRGENLTIEAGAFGKRLKLLGFKTERDAKGKKLQLSEAARSRAKHLLRDFGGSEVSDDPGQAGKGNESTPPGCT